MPPHANALEYKIQKLGSSVIITTGSRAPDAKSLQTEISIKDVIVDNVLPLAKSPVADLVAAIRGRRLTVASLFELAAAIEKAHHKAGYALTRVMLPQQTIHPGGTVRVSVVDVRVEKIVAKEMPPVMATRLEALLTPLVNKSELSSAALAASVGAAQFELGRTLNFETSDGSREDTVNLVVSGPANRFLSELSTTAFLSRPVRSALIGASTTAYGLLGENERISVGGFWSREWDTPTAFGPISGVNASSTFPLGDRGPFQLETAVGTVEERFDKPGSSIDSYSNVQLGAHIVLPIFFDASQSLVLKAGPEYKNEHENYTVFFADGSGSLSMPFETLAFRGSAAWIKSFPSDIKLELGVDVLGGEVRNIDYLSSGSPSDSSKPILAARPHFKMDMPIFFDAVLTASVQAEISALRALPPSEEFPLLPTNTFLPLDPRAILGDTGGSMRMEIARNFIFPVEQHALSIQPYGFGSIGTLFQRETIFNFAEHVQGFAGGGGLRFSVPPPHGDAPLFEGDVEIYRQQTSAETPNFTAMTVTLKTKF